MAAFCLTQRWDLGLGRGKTCPASALSKDRPNEDHVGVRGCSSDDRAYEGGWTAGHEDGLKNGGHRGRSVVRTPYLRRDNVLSVREIGAMKLRTALEA